VFFSYATNLVPEGGGAAERTCSCALVRLRPHAYAVGDGRVALVMRQHGQLGNTAARTRASEGARISRSASRASRTIALAAARARRTRSSPTSRATGRQRAPASCSRRALVRERNGDPLGHEAAINGTFSPVRRSERFGARTSHRGGTTRYYRSGIASRPLLHAGDVLVLERALVNGHLSRTEGFDEAHDDFLAGFRVVLTIAAAWVASAPARAQACSTR